MKKLVSFRIEKMANEKVLGQINHDMRIGKIPKYIDKTRTAKNVLLFGERLSKESYENLIKEQNKRSKRKIQKNTERFFSGIMTFSETMREDYKDSPKLFKESALRFIKELEEKEGLQISYAEIHLDETTPHIHLLFDNISKENGKSLRRKINPKKLSHLQTVLGDNFENMGYERGKSKLTTQAEHFDFKDYHRIKKEIGKMKIELDDKNKELDEYKRELKLFNKLYSDEILDDKEKEALRLVAPRLFQFLDKASSKQKKALNESISKGLNRG